MLSEITQDFSQEIEELRDSLGYTQADFCESLGVPLSTYKKRVTWVNTGGRNAGLIMYFRLVCFLYESKAGRVLLREWLEEEK